MAELLVLLGDVEAGRCLWGPRKGRTVALRQAVPVREKQAQCVDEGGAVQSSW